jgi:hypothetical protein
MIIRPPRVYSLVCNGLYIKMRVLSTVVEYLCIFCDFFISHPEICNFNYTICPDGKIAQEKGFPVADIWLSAEYIFTEKVLTRNEWSDRI